MRQSKCERIIPVKGMKNSGQSARKAEQDLTIEIILRKIELYEFKKELSKLFGLTFTKSLKQFHALYGNNPLACLYSPLSGKSR